MRRIVKDSASSLQDFTDCHRITDCLPIIAKPDNNKPGTGLGLAIARRAIKMHGGTIAAANRADSGLQITIELP